MPASVVNGFIVGDFLSQFRRFKAARSVTHRENLDLNSADAINYPIASDEDSSNIGAADLRNDPPGEGEVWQMLH